MSTSHGPGTGDDPLLALALLPGVAEAVERARAAVDGARGHRALRRRGPEVAAESALRGARASAVLEGAEVDLGSLRAAVRAGAAVEGSHQGVVQGAVRVSAELGGLVATWRRAPLQVLARLHVLAAADLVTGDALGRPRTGGVEGDGPGGLGPAPSPAEVGARLEALGVLATQQSGAPALVTAAVVHGELLVLRPFVAADGLVARAAARITLVARGLDPQGVVVPEAGHLSLGRGAYTEALRGYASGTPAGVARWVVHCGEAVTRGAREISGFCDALEAGSEADEP